MIQSIRADVIKDYCSSIYTHLPLNWALLCRNTFALIICYCFGTLFPICTTQDTLTTEAPSTQKPAVQAQKCKIEIIIQQNKTQKHIIRGGSLGQTKCWHQIFCYCPITFNKRLLYLCIFTYSWQALSNL